MDKRSEQLLPDDTFLQSADQQLVREHFRGYAAFLPSGQFGIGALLNVAHVVMDDAMWLKKCLDRMIAENQRLAKESDKIGAEAKALRRKLRDLEYQSTKARHRQRNGQ
jgi:predicted nuclease with TOPRIM domain